MLTFRHFIKKLYLQSLAILSKQFQIKTIICFPGQGAAILDGVWQPRIRTWNLAYFLPWGSVNLTNPISL